MFAKTGWIAIVLTVCILLSAGCVRRRLTVRTQPAGAAVYVDKQYIGSSPTATPVTYYGTREIEVVRDGYRTEKILRTFNPPWYQLPPLDFVSETLWPRKIRDERIVDIALVPEQTLSSEELQQRASGLRIQAAQGVATPLPPSSTESAPIFLDGSTPSQPFPNQPNAAMGPMGQNDLGFDQLNPNSLPPQPMGRPWQPGQFLRDFFLPGGSPPTRIPEVDILPGGGYRPEF